MDSRDLVLQPLINVISCFWGYGSVELSYPGAVLQLYPQYRCVKPKPPQLSLFVPSLAVRCSQFAVCQ